MYKEEKVIDGILCVRYSTDDQFEPYSRTDLTKGLLLWKKKCEAIVGFCRRPENREEQQVEVCDKIVDFISVLVWRKGKRKCPVWMPRQQFLRRPL